MEHHEPNLPDYNRIVVAFSGGKDSLATVLLLLDAGVPRDNIELHHHDVDGGSESGLMDWPITPAYCQAVADALGMKLFFSYKVGGFEREMLRDNTRTAPMRWQREDGSWRESGGDRGKGNTRQKFPQVSPDLSVRWCSAYLKIDVLAALIRNEPRFERGKTLVVTGERAQESAARAKYNTFEPDRADNRDGVRTYRFIDHWRPIHAWTEDQVWEIIERHGVVPHPAYQLGWGRLSCRTCIFGSANQWATVREIYPTSFERVATYEDQFGVTIKRDASVRNTADRGVPYAAAIAQPELAAFADQSVWSGPVIVNDWKLPAGAYGENGGPT